MREKAVEYFDRAVEEGYVGSQGPDCPHGRVFHERGFDELSKHLFRRARRKAGLWGLDEEDVWEAVQRTLIEVHKRHEWGTLERLGEVPMDPPTSANSSMAQRGTVPFAEHILSDSVKPPCIMKQVAIERWKRGKSFRSLTPRPEDEETV